MSRCPCGREHTREDHRRCPCGREHTREDHRREAEACGARWRRSSVACVPCNGTGSVRGLFGPEACARCQR